MIKKIDRKALREKKHRSIRSKISGTPERPRLTVFKSLKNIFVQVIDDVNGKTLVSASTIEKGNKLNGANIANAKLIGERIAKKAKEAGINKIVFDRSGYIYTGVIKALADAAREAGLEF